MVSRGFSLDPLLHPSRSCSAVPCHRLGPPRTASDAMALRRFNAGGKKQKELTDEQKQEMGGGNMEIQWDHLWVNG